MNVQGPYRIVSLDISAQEPMINTLLSREPRWLEIFRNRHLRVLKLTRYLDILFQENFNLDPDSIRSVTYWRWLHERFHDNYDPLIEFNQLVDRFNRGDSTVEEELKKLAEQFVVDFVEYQKNGGHDHGND